MVATVHCWSVDSRLLLSVVSASCCHQASNLLDESRTSL
jgi:hypothetical protein